MKRKSLLFTAFAATAFLLVSPNLFTNITQPPTGYTGAFLNGGGNEPTCNSAGCHEGGSVVQNSQAINLLAVSSPSLANGYDPLTTYNLSVNAGNGTAAYGFSLTAVTASGSPAGSFTLSNPNSTSHQVGANGKEYVGHKDANSANAWAFRWVSPATDVDVYFFLAANQANGNGENTGDQIHLRTYKANFSSFGAVSVTAVEDIAALADGKISVFPNPVRDNVNLDFTLTASQPVKVGVYNLNGQLVKPLMDETLTWGDHSRSFSVGGELSTGIYLVKFNVGQAEYFKKIVVE